jgi:hypothetical protein
MKRNLDVKPRTTHLPRHLAFYLGHFDAWTTWLHGKVVAGYGTLFSLWSYSGSSLLYGGFVDKRLVHRALIIFFALQSFSMIILELPQDNIIRNGQLSTAMNNTIVLRCQFPRSWVFANNPYLLGWSWNTPHPLKASQGIGMWRHHNRTHSLVGGCPVSSVWA